MSSSDGTIGVQSDRNDSTKTLSKLAQINNGRWTNEEHLRFIEALKLYGKDWNKVQEHIATRTAA